jgi:hypothetical protein
VEVVLFGGRSKDFKTSLLEGRRGVVSRAVRKKGFWSFGSVPFAVLRPMPMLLPMLLHMLRAIPLFLLGGDSDVHMVRLSNVSTNCISLPLALRDVRGLICVRSHAESGGNAANFLDVIVSSVSLNCLRAL